jgi:hypothetical protein
MSSYVSVCARYERSVESGVLGMSVVVTPEGVRRWCVGGVFRVLFSSVRVCLFPSLHGYGGTSLRRIP